MSNLKVFENNQFGRVRVSQKDGQVWFVGKDVAEVLNYSNPNGAVSTHVDDEDKGVAKHDTPGGRQNMTIINESGMYSLVLSSKMPKAKDFKRWVTSEVLPSIRKHGMYAEDELLENPDLLIKVATQLKEEKLKRKRLEAENNKKEQIIGELQPKADYTDEILKSNGLVTITQIAKDYGMSGQAMNQLLHDLNVQYKQSGQWLLYSHYQHQGFTKSETYKYDRSDGTTGTKLLTKWTQKGRLFLYKLLKENGILPVMEQERMEEAI